MSIRLCAKRTAASAFGSLARHCREQTFRVAAWEVCNEPDIGESGGTPHFFRNAEDYNRFYTHTVAGLLRGDPDAQVGGPAGAGRLDVERRQLAIGLIDRIAGDLVPADRRIEKSLRGIEIDPARTGHLGQVAPSEQTRRLIHLKTVDARAVATGPEVDDKRLCRSSDGSRQLRGLICLSVLSRPS